ncbi:signal recognition particle receptor subunit alpha isoform X3 [Pangasianodon hypophthalmus]|uniref:signal recognition particle receptor subunit alpha isoform X3 n=1 Tax=Pangasianodon hypophthalmus TaxID=310915 RepID=UPI0023073374|nr:signal recognition particle receptor subunit alpha isoform X3 [Pangasianodon hypophthalmus]
MLDFFAIFSKGGIVLWCFQGAGVTESFTGPVNALIRSVILQERAGNSPYSHNALNLKYKLDNEFELVFVVGFQKILTLTYVDKLIDDVQLHFRDRYKNELEQRDALKFLIRCFEFDDDFQRLLRVVEAESIAKPQKAMRTYSESQKSQKTVKSMIETKSGDKSKESTGKKNKHNKKEVSTVGAIIRKWKEHHFTINRSRPGAPCEISGRGVKRIIRRVVQEPRTTCGELQKHLELAAGAGGGEQVEPSQASSKKAVDNRNQGLSQEEIIQKNLAEFIRRQAGGRTEKSNKSPKPQKPKGKEKRIWDMGGTSTKDLDYSGTNNKSTFNNQGQDEEFPAETQIQVGSMKGELRDVDYESSEDIDEEEEERKDMLVTLDVSRKGARKGGIGGMFGVLKGLVGSKTLTRQDMEPVLEKMKDHLIAVASMVKQALQDALVQILQPKRRVDILRDVLEAQAQHKPFVITFCGVNGVGKSTNLAKISYWLIENGFSVLIAACDTFRAGAVEQLRTHQRRLNSLHPPQQHGRPVVQLFERGYGKDAAGIAMEAIAYARNQGFDVVLVDTAGRMQDNAPLMTALAKLIAVNTPDLVLFVGEALVGNEAVDQLVKFNQALADHSMSDHPRLIDGIVLTKFDTIDDKVGAAISMTYITSQPIVFVGTGQTYNDLRSLNARAVVNALMKA